MSHFLDFARSREVNKLEMESWLVIGISGVTCSGKTSLANTLQKHFKEMKGKELKTGVELNRVELINQDDYFRAVIDPKHQIIEKLNHINWEIVESIDMDKMITDIMNIMGKKFVLYNTKSSALANNQNDNLFTNHFTNNQHLPSMKFKGNNDLISDDDHYNYKKIIKHNSILNILIVEGFLILNHAVTLDLCNVKYHLHIPYEICYARRNKRVYEPADVIGNFKLFVYLIRNP